MREGGIPMDILNAITDEYKKNDIPDFHIGDTVRVHIKIKEGSRERIQIFEGFVLKRQNGGVSETFTVRRIASGVGVEKTFPVHSPRIEKIEIVKRGEVRRAKLNYMRSRTGKSAKIKGRILTDEQLAAEKAAIEAERQERAAMIEAEAAAAQKAAEEAAAAEAAAEEAPAEEAVAEEAPAEAVEETAPAEEAAPADAE
jgi:ribosomal protein L19, bacterial type